MSCRNSQQCLFGFPFQLASAQKRDPECHREVSAQPFPGATFTTENLAPVKQYVLEGVSPEAVAIPSSSCLRAEARANKVIYYLSCRLLSIMWVAVFQTYLLAVFFHI